MNKRGLTGRVIRILALTALVATPILVVAAGPAGAIDVSDQDSLEQAFEDESQASIVLTADIVINSDGDAGCDQFTRHDGVALVIDGQGHSITKDDADCEDEEGNGGERIFRSYDDNSPITFQNVTVSGGVKVGGSGGALKTDGSVDVINSTFSNNQALHCSYKDNSDVESEGYCPDPYGGAIYAEGSVNVTGSVFSDNFAEGAGGAVFALENITVNNSTFQNNSVEWGSKCFCSGGAFVTYGGADVTDSAITGNSATCDHWCGAEGGGFWAANFTSVANSTVTGNTASCSFGCGGLGGGFSGAGFSAGSLAGSTAAAVGAAAADPGNIVVQNSVVSGNTASCGFDQAFFESQGGGNGVCGAGGGFAALDADTVTVDHSTVSDNQALCTLEESDVQAAGSSEICGGGGGFYFENVGTVDVNASTLSGNTATIFGSALANLPVFANDAAVCEADCGYGVDVTMTNSTVTGNTAGELAAVFVYGQEGDTLTLVHDTIVQNTTDFNLLIPIIGASADEPEGLPVNVYAVSLTSFGTIVAQPTLVLPEVTAHVDPVGVNCATAFGTDSQGYNFTDDDSCEFDDPTDIVTTPNDPALLALGAYGGPTNTMRPEGEIDGTTVVSLSPVVDKIPAAACVLDVDQRGVSRPQTVVADACDIGAVEITASEITISPEVVTVITPKFTG